MTIFQFVDLGAAGLGEQLVAHADATYRFVALTHLLADNVHGIFAHVRVARTIGQKESVKVHCRVVVVPRYTNHLDTTIDETTNDIVFHATVHEYHLFAGTFVIADDFLATHLVHEVHTLVVGLGHIVGFIIKENLAHHHTMLAEHLGQFTRVDASDAGHFLALEPVCQTLHGVPVAIILAVV